MYDQQNERQSEYDRQQAARALAAQRRKRNLLLMIAGIAIVAVLFCTWLFALKTETVEPGQNLVVIDKPYFVGSGGIRQEPVKEGRIMLWMTSDVIPVIVTPQAVGVRFDDISTKDNSLLDFNTIVQVQVIDPVGLIRDFGVNWFENNLSGEYGNIVRRSVKMHTFGEVMSDAAVGETIDQEVTMRFADYVKSSLKGYVKVVGFAAGRAHPDDAVMAQVNQTSKEQERKRTLIEATEAEKKREEEQRARAVADNAYRNEMKLDTAQFVALEQAKILGAACQKAANCIVTSGGSGVLVGAK